MAMRSQKPTEHFVIDPIDSDKEDIRCYHHSSYIFNRDTYQMSPLLFESDTEDSTQSTAIKCYQDQTIITPRRSTTTPNRQMMATLNDLRNVISSQLDTSSQHNQCCSETLLNSSMHRSINETKANTHSAYISPSPRVTRSKWLRSRILTRSAKRLHKISELSEYSDSLRSTRKPKAKNDLRKETRSSSDAKDSSKCTTVDSDKRTDVDEGKLIESIRKSKVRVVLERLKFPFFQNPHQIHGKFIQPNIVPNIVVDEDDADDLNFLNRRLSTEVQILTEQPVVISISSESTIHNVPTPPCPRRSPDLFENFESSSASNLCSQNSIDIPNGQVLMGGAELRLSGSTTSTPSNQHTSTLMPSIFDLFNNDCVTPINANVSTKKDKQSVQQHAFEITVNEVFDNVIYVADSEHTITPQIANLVDEQEPAETPKIQSPKPVDECIPQRVPSHLPTTVTNDNFVNLIQSTKCSSSQEVTPKKRPEIPSLLNKSVGACPSTPLNRTKWLSKPRSGSSCDRSDKTSQRCRRLELWFHNENKQRHKGNVDRKRKFANILLTSSEEEDS